MITHSERTRLVERFRNDPAYAAGATIKSIVCLALLAGISYVGVITGPVEDDGSGYQLTQAESVPNAVEPGVLKAALASEQRVVASERGSDKTTESRGVEPK
jgi:hypothetical protein